MSTHYIDNQSSGSQYYFNNDNASTSQSYRTYTSPVTTTTATKYSSSDYSTGLSGAPRSSYIQDDPYHLPQQHQSVAGFNKSVSHQRYQSPQSPVHQVRATVRSVNNQDQYQPQISPQQHHFQFDSHQQPGHATGPPVVYQTPGAAQFTHHNVDLWTENPSQGHDHYAQAQRVSVRSVSTGSPHQSHSISPPKHQDPLQQYYSQLTPEQHQQLLRQQQLQRQQQHDSSHEPQQRTVIIQQSSPSSLHQDQYRSTASIGGGGQQHQQVSPIQQRGRIDSDRQRQEEQAQRLLATQRALQEEFSQPVGIRGLMNKFAGPSTGPKFPPRSKSTSSRQYSSSSYTSNAGPGRTTTRTSTMHSMTYSALPKAREPPVNSVEYYQMQLQQSGGNPFTNIQQAAAPAHIQHASSGFGSPHDRFKGGSLSDNFNQQQDFGRRQQQQPPPQQQQQTGAGGNTLSSIRNQYMNQAKVSAQNEYAAQQEQNISRTIIGEDIPRQKQQQQQQIPQSQIFAPQGAPQEQPPAQQFIQKEKPQIQNENTEQSAAPSDVTSHPAAELESSSY